MLTIFSRFSLAQRIGSGFLVIIVLLGAITLVGLNALDDTRKALELVVSRDAKNVREAARMVQDLISLQRAEKNLILARTQQEMNDYEKAITEFDASLRLRLHSLSASVDEEGAEILNRFRSFFEHYSKTQKEIVTLTRRNSNTQARKLSQGDGQRLYEELSYLIESLVKESETTAISNAENLADKALLKAGYGNQVLGSLLDTLENKKSILFEDSPTEIPGRVERVEKAHQNIRDNVLLLEGLVHGPEKDRLLRFKKRWLKYVETTEKIIRLAQDGVKDQAQALYRKSGRTQHEIALRALRQFIKQIELELNRTRKLVHSAIEKAQLGNRTIRSLSKIHRAEKDLILTISPAEMQRYSARISLLSGALTNQLDKLELLVTSKEVRPSSRFVH